MINTKTIATGSKGNCYKVWNEDTVIMIECGIDYKKIQKGFDFKLREVQGCLVTHLHKDHCKAMPKLLPFGIDCYTSAETAMVIGPVWHHRLNVIKPNKPFHVGSFNILPFETQHNCDGSLGFLIFDTIGDDVLMFITDSYYCEHTFKGLTHLMIEANYCDELLEKNVDAGRVAMGLRNTIIQSHFNIERTKEFIETNMCDSLRSIELIHISSMNGNPGSFKRQVQEITGVPVYVKGV